MQACSTVVQIVVLSQVLACDATLGYEEMHNTQVLRFNGTKIRNLAHLAELTTTCTQPFMRFDLDLDVRLCSCSDHTFSAASVDHRMAPLTITIMASVPELRLCTEIL